MVFEYTIKSNQNIDGKSTTYLELNFQPLMWVDVYQYHTDENPLGLIN